MTRMLQCKNSSHVETVCMHIQITLYKCIRSMVLTPLLGGVRVNCTSGQCVLRRPSLLPRFFAGARLPAPTAVDIDF